MKTTKFKPSEIGPIPAEWEVKRLGEVCSRIKNGFAYDFREHGTFPVSRIETISSGSIDYHRVGLLENEPPHEYLMQHGDILYSHINSLPYIGNVAQYYGERPLYHGMNLLLLRPAQEIDAKYLHYVLASEPMRRLSRMAAKVAINQASINTSELKNFPIRFPPRAEQEKIAAALSDVDELLAAMTTLIVKKRAIKQGAMQELLEVRPTALTQRAQSAQRDATGFSHGERGEHGEEKTCAPRRRLAGFTGAWVERRLGDVCLINPSESRDLPEEFTYIDLESVVGGALIMKNVISKDCAPSRAQRIFRTGDVLFQTVRPYQQNNLFVDFNADAFVASTGYAVVRGNEGVSDSRFIYHVMLTERFTTQVLDRCTGTSYPAINPRALGDVVICLPSDIAEQKAIAGVLADMDAEIAALEAKRAKYEQIKQGMMQELLTGKTRLEA